MVYSSGSLSLALLELLAQAGSPTRLLSFVYLSAEIDPQYVADLERPLPDGWNSLPVRSASCEIGDRWLAQERSLVLKVPSVLVPIEFNYLINPAHPDFSTIEISDPSPIQIDPRILAIG